MGKMRECQMAICNPSFHGQKNVLANCIELVKILRMNPDSDLGKGPEASPHRPEMHEESFDLPVEGFSGTPEEKDRQWFEGYYKGDRQKQLTLRAVLMGGILGMFMAVSNLYTTLKLGWSFGVSITACVISFV